MRKTNLLTHKVYHLINLTVNNFIGDKMDEINKNLLKEVEATDSVLDGGAVREVSLKDIEEQEKSTGTGSGIEDLVISEDEFYERLQKSQGSPFLNVKEVEEKGIKVVKVKDVIKFYLRQFPDKDYPTPRADILVEVVNECPAKGNDYVFTLNKTTIEKLKEEFDGKLSQKLPDQLIMVNVDKSGKTKYLTANKYVQI